MTQSFTLTSDVVFHSSGFIINANDMTLDLGGHQISRAAGGSPGAGIAIRVFHGVMVKNGTVKGFTQGIQLVH